MHLMRIMVVALLLCAAVSAGPAYGAAIPRMNDVVAYEGTWEAIGKQQAYYFPRTTITTAMLIQTLMDISSTDAIAYYELVEDLLPADVRAQLAGHAAGLSEYWLIPPDLAWSFVLCMELGGDMYWYSQEQMQPACSAFAFHSDNGTLLCHNSDQPTRMLTIWSSLRFVPTSGQAFVSVGVPPGATSASMARNDAGIGIIYNLGRPNPRATAGVPIMLQVRSVIASATTLDEAVDQMTAVIDDGGTYSYMGGNVLIVDFNTGELARLQIISDDIRVTYGETVAPGVTCVYATNHFDDDFAPIDPADEQDPAVVSSRARFARLEQLVAAGGRYDAAQCWAILTDADGGAPTNNTICRKSDSAQTVYSNVFADNETTYTIGVPSEYLARYAEPMRMGVRDPIVAAVGGTVATYRGRPIARARVRLLGLSVRGVSLKTRTGADGAFVFNNLLPGLYLVWVRRPVQQEVLVNWAWYTGEEPVTLEFVVPF